MTTKTDPTDLVVDRLIITHIYEDEWPARVGELIVDLARRYAKVPSLADLTTADIACELEAALFDEGVMHEECGVTIDRRAAGAEYTYHSTVIVDDRLRRALARAASVRLHLPEAVLLQLG